MELPSLLYIDTLTIHLKLCEGEGERLLNHKCLSLFFLMHSQLHLSLFNLKCLCSLLECKPYSMVGDFVVLSSLSVELRTVSGT